MIDLNKSFRDHPSIIMAAMKSEMIGHSASFVDRSHCELATLEAAERNAVRRSGPAGAARRGDRIRFPLDRIAIHPDRPTTAIIAVSASPPVGIILEISGSAGRGHGSGQTGQDHHCHHSGHKGPLGRHHLDDIRSNAR